MSTLLAVQRLKSPHYQQRVVLWNLLILLWVATALLVVIHSDMGN